MRHAPLRSRRSLLILGVLTLLTLLLAGCGGGDDDDVSSTQQPSATATSTPSSDGSRRVVEQGDTVAVNYRGTLEDGEVFDSSEGRDPLEFEVGSGQVIEGFDNAVLGLAVGDKITVTLPPDQAYGERRDDLIFDVDASGAPEGLAVGDRVRLANGAPATVIAINDNTIRVDANHELAGKTLIFEIELVEIR